LRKGIAEVCLDHPHMKFPCLSELPASNQGEKGFVYFDDIHLRCTFTLKFRDPAFQLPQYLRVPGGKKGANNDVWRDLDFLTLNPPSGANTPSDARGMPQDIGP
jgi:hypothetical protein